MIFLQGSKCFFATDASNRKKTLPVNLIDEFKNESNAYYGRLCPAKGGMPDLVHRLYNCLLVVEIIIALNYLLNIYDLA